MKIKKCRDVSEKCDIVKKFFSRLTLPIILGLVPFPSSCNPRACNEKQPNTAEKKKYYKIV
jgi:hypothetical protein